MLKSYSIGNHSATRIPVAPGLVLAPMSGVTTSAFRRLIKELNPGAVGLLISEFISIEGMTREGRRSLEMMRYREEERPYGIQIFGFDIVRMRDAALMVQEAGADLIDINCGCPAPKVVKKGGGCELMRHPEHLKEMIREVRQAVSIPLTIKMRAGWDNDSRNAMEIAKIAEGEGADGVTIHGRTRAEMYRGEANWEIVEEIASTLSIPVCGSGDVVNYESAIERWRDPIAGLFIGRAAIENPYVFTEIVTNTPRNVRRDTPAMLRIISRYMELLLEDFEPRGCVGKVKQLASQMGKGAPWSKAICRANSFEEQAEIVKRAKDEEVTGPLITEDQWSQLS